MKNNNFIIFLILFLSFLLSGCFFSPKTEVFFSKDTAKYPLGEYVVKASNSNCTINWHISKTSNINGKRRLDVRYEKYENNSFIATKDLHRAILKEIFKRWKAEEFDSLIWGPFSKDKDYSWCVPIAVASANSPEYQDYKKNYPQSKMESTNSIFVKLANKTKPYKELNNLFNEFGARIELKSVEKVFSKKVSDLPFKAELNKKGISDNERVLYDAGMTYFKIEKQK